MRILANLVALAIAALLAGCSGPDFTWELRIHVQDGELLDGDVPFSYDGYFYVHDETFADVSEGLSSKPITYWVRSVSGSTESEAQPRCSPTFTSGCGPIIRERQELYPGNFQLECFDDDSAEPCGNLVSGPPR